MAAPMGAQAPQPEEITFSQTHTMTHTQIYNDRDVAVARRLQGPENVGFNAGVIRQAIEAEIDTTLGNYWQTLQRQEVEIARLHEELKKRDPKWDEAFEMDRARHRSERPMHTEDEQ